MFMVYACSQSLLMSMIEYLYNDDYDLYPIYVDVSDQGHSGARRPRVCLQ